MAGSKVPPARDAEQVAALLDSPEIAAFIAKLQETRWTGRPGYSVRSMVGMALTKTMYALPTWTRTVRLVTEHVALQSALDCVGNVPSIYACYRFATKLREHSDALTSCIDAVLASLRDRIPELGKTVAIDASDMPAYANGHRNVGHIGGPLRTRYADPDATWGHRSAISTRKGGGYYGFKLHAAVCTATELPIAWTVQTASGREIEHLPELLDTLVRRDLTPDAAVMDKGYDGSSVHDACNVRDIRPVVAIKNSPSVLRGEHLGPKCEHGRWTFAGADAKRCATKWRCPSGKCKPASVWVKADRLHPLIPYSSPRYKALYRQRWTVERAFGRLKHEWGMAPLRVRGVERVRLHVDLTILTKLAVALAIQQDAATIAA